MAMEQLTFFEEVSSALLTSSLVSAPELNAAFFQSYDSIISTFSGGKDSIAQTLTIIESGAPLEKIELWHHLIDGREGSEFMDWPCTEGYCRAFAQAIGVPLYASWKKGGFEGELLRKNKPTATNYFETPSALQSSGGCGPNGTRERFPQVSADLSVRWCSAYLKIDVAAAALRNQDRFLGKRVLFLTGERASESPGRAKYRPFEPHRTDLRHGKHYQRHVDHLRPIHWKYGRKPPRVPRAEECRTIPSLHQASFLRHCIRFPFVA